jgi:DNA-binding beta-propeller fold protein YncE
VPNTEASGLASDLAGDRIYFEVASGGQITGRDLDTPETVLLTLNPGLVFWEDMAFDGAFLWRAEFNSHTVKKIDPSDGSIDFSFMPFGFGRPPMGLAWDGSHLWVSGFINGRVQQFTPGGVATGNPFPIGGHRAGGLAFDTTDNTLWVGADGAVFHYTTAGLQLGSFAVPVNDGRFVDGLEFQAASVSTPIPEPGSLVLTLSGVAVLSVLVWKRSRREERGCNRAA